MSLGKMWNMKMSSTGGRPVDLLEKQAPDVQADLVISIFIQLIMKGEF